MVLQQRSRKNGIRDLKRQIEPIPEALSVILRAHPREDHTQRTEINHLPTVIAMVCSSWNKPDVQLNNSVEEGEQQDDAMEYLSLSLALSLVPQWKMKVENLMRVKETANGNEN